VLCVPGLHAPACKAADPPTSPSPALKAILLAEVLMIAICARASNSHAHLTGHGSAREFAAKLHQP